MFCPNYKNKEVFDGFNKMVEAFGGRALSEEEFRSADLRNERTGLDYLAMEAAYTTYDRNNGNFLDLAPNGKPSLLFQTLLEYTVDEKEAIKMKSNVYSDEFFKWFGNWIIPATPDLAEDENISSGEVSKVVDENGEPLIVYHASTKLFEEFDKEKATPPKFDSYYNVDPFKDVAFYFSTSSDYAFGMFTTSWSPRRQLYPVYLNIKNIFTEHLVEDSPKTKRAFFRDGYFHVHTNNVGRALAAIRDLELNVDGFVGKDTGFEDSDHTEFAVINPNQIKHVENLGTFNPNNPNIYKIPAFNDRMQVEESIANISYSGQFKNAGFTKSFSTGVAQKLLNGEKVSSKEIVADLKQTDAFSIENSVLADILGIHDVPVHLDSELENDTLATTEILDDGTTIIALNHNLIDKVSQGFLSEAILHEIIHAVTVPAFLLQNTKERKDLARATSRITKMLRKAYSKEYILLSDVESAKYALSDDAEFASIFMTDAEARNEFFNLARQLDNHKGFVMRALSNFINSLASLFVNKTLIKDNQQKLNDYHNILTKHLVNAPIIQKGKPLSKEEISLLRKAIDKRTAYNEYVIETSKRAEKRSNIIQANAIKVWKKLDPDSAAAKSNPYDFNQIINALKIRINAIRTSSFTESEKNKYITDTQIQIDMLGNDNITKWVAMSSIIAQAVPQLLSDIKEIRSMVNAGELPSSKDLMYQIHSNFKLYENVIGAMGGLLNQNDTVSSILQQFNERAVSDKDKLQEKDINHLRQVINDAAATIQDGLKLLQILHHKWSIDTIQSIGKKVNNPDIDLFIQQIESDPTVVSTGISGIERMFSAMDSMDNTILRTMEYILNNALTKAEDKVTAKADEFTRVLSRLGVGESILDCYEYDDNGRTTGWLARDRNFGKFYQDYDAEILRINQVIKEKYHLDDLDVELNRTAPQQEDARKEWNHLKNEWCKKFAERKMLPEYYEMWNEVSSTAKAALGAINTEISAILSKKGVIDDNGRRHLEILTDEEFRDYNKLIIQKNLLKSDIDEFGHPKTGTSLEIAKELQAVYEKMNSSSDELTFAIEEWQEELDYNIENVWGGREEYNKYLAGEENDFDEKAFKKWHSRNSVYRMKEENGEAIVYHMIDEEMGDSVVDYGPEVDALLEERRKIYAAYKGSSREVLGSEISQGLRASLKKLDIEISKAKRRAKAKSPQLRNSVAKKNRIRKKYIKYVPTYEFEQLKAEARKMAAGDEEKYWSLMLNYGYMDDDSGYEFYRPYSYFTRAVAIDESLMEYVPNIQWVNRSENRFKNPDFIESYGANMIPKKIGKYDNSIAYEKVSKTGTALNDLYTLVQKTIAESNAMQTNRQYTDDYLLPQEAGSIWKKMKNHGWFGWFPVLIRHIFEKIGLGIGKFSRSHIEEDLVDLGSSAVLDSVDESTGLPVESSPIKGKYPDGREFHILPQYYTRRLKDPSQLSSDLVGIVLDYYKMSCYYDAKSNIRDDMELLLDFMRQDKYEATDTQFANEKGKKKREPGAVEAAKQFLEMKLYDMRRLSKTFKLGPFEWQWTKFVDEFKNYTTTRNLGWSPKVALVGMATSLHAHHINMLVGQNYGKLNAARATWYVLQEVFFHNVGGIGMIANNDSNNIISKISEKYRFANQFERKTKHSNRSRGVRAAQLITSPFNMLSFVDFITKAIIAVSILDNYHLVDGKFISEDQLKSSRYLYTDEEYEEKYRQYKTGVTLYSQMKVVDKELVFPSSYDEHTNHIITNQIQKIAEYADGMATPLQRAAITRSWVGCFIMIHKQFLPLILQRAFGKRVYDYDMEQYKNGVFRNMFKYIYEIAANNFLAGTALSTVAGIAFFSQPYMIGLSSLAGAALYGYGKYQRKQTGEKSKSIKQINKEWFHNFEDEKSTKISNQNKYDLKEFLWKVALYHVLALGVTMLCAKADDDDDDQWLQFLAYIARAFQWEAYTEFRMDDLLNTFKSPTPATGTIDAIQEIGHTVSPQGNFLDVPSLFYEYGDEVFDDIITTPGAYEGKTKLERSIIKATPYKNWIEQIHDSQKKRNYFENQIMHIEKD